jgi:NADH-quinone oxidoreductase subunit N
LAGLLKGRRLASEAALKYAVYGGGTAGVMLYGISLIAGLSNAAHLPTVAANLAERLPAMGGDERMVLMVASLLVMVGLAFKLSAVPFHFWCPDVFEGATAEVAAFLSVASKAAALGLLVRVALGLGGQMPVGLPAGQIETAQAGRTAPALAAAQEAPASGRAPAAGELGSAAAGQAPAATAGDRLRPLQALLARLIAFLAVVTCTFGNLAAYGQSNIKRLLAYSTIAHAGYMMMAVPALIALGGSHPQAAERAASALGVYIGVYLFLNLGAFAVVAVLRNAMRSEELRDYAGLIRHCPGIVICFSIILFGLVGVPPLSGFIGKFVVFAALWEGYSLTSQAYLLALLVLGGLNTVLSLFYYLRVIKTMAIDPDADTRGPVILPVVSPAGLYVAAVTLPTLLLFVRWNSLYEFSLAAARQLLG